MRTRRRLIAAIAIAALCAPGTWLRSEVGWQPPESISLTKVAGESETGTPSWRVEGVWHYSAQSLLFGGFSALVALPDGRLQAFSDRGARFTFAAPDTSAHAHEVARQPIDPSIDIVDFEAAALDPANGTYWIALENYHGIHRFASDHTPTGMRALDADALDWSDNTGAEAMARLDDGRFLIIPEGRRTGLLFATDPVADGTYETFDYVPPIAGHATTELAQLPDGRVLVLLRNLDHSGGMPPFESKIAIARPPLKNGTNAWAPEVELDLAGVVPRENYEGMAVREEGGGAVAVWLIADDNMSVLQRTLVVKLVYDPASAQD